MGRSRLTPLGAVVGGAVAGAAGTVVMDCVWYARYRRGGGEDGFADWEFSSSTLAWDEAAAPAQVGRRVLEGFLQRELPDRWAGPTNNVVHWAYGLMWGSLYGVVAGSAPRPRVAYGPLLGTVAWASGYVVLPLAKLYKPVWEYDAVTLARDLSAHLAFGTATAAVFRVLAHRGL
ncbi:MAG TPA: hypothetical protein VHH09_08525 [Acidimicrobiales bacterium]|nr:hypothetical protein [Acidimicrobiales bacterium]